MEKENKTLGTEKYKNIESLYTNKIIQVKNIPNIAWKQGLILFAGLTKTGKTLDLNGSTNRCLPAWLHCSIN